MFCMTQHRGHRSELNEQRRFVKHLVLESSRRDTVKAEMVCLLDNPQAVRAVEEKFGSAIVGAASFEKGEVVVDSRGKGSLQLPDNRQDWEAAIE